MAKEKAKAFLEHLMQNPELMDKMKGFSQDELKEALEDLQKEGKVPENEEMIPHLAF
jgi:molybdopterin-biosynthesis enzyme MoeA-like protein